MLRKVISAAVVMCVCLGIALAEEIRNVTISKIEGNKVTFAKMKKGEKVGEDKTLTAASDVKIVKGKYNKDTKTTEAGDTLEGGLKALSTKVGEKGVLATIITDDGGSKITEIRVMGGRGKKKDN